MAGLGDTILGLSRLRRQREEAMANLAEPLRLKLIAPAGRNPGELRMLAYVPPGLPPGAPLVVALHGCTQNAAAYDHGAGWSVLAERHGFAVLFPEQTRHNNARLCLNWYEPHDIRPGEGEVESIRAMTVQMQDTYGLDRRRTYVTGLSAGGAMTAAMVATAPGLFAGAGIVAGLPYASAGSVPEALEAMMGHRVRPAAEWGDRVRAAAGGYNSHWPQIQIWHGTNDTVVTPANGRELVKQWTNVLGLAANPSATDQVDGAQRDTWLGTDGRPALQFFTVPGLGHGVPVGIAGDDADHTSGVPGPHMLAADIDSTWHMANQWGLLTAAPRPRTAPRPNAGRPAAESIVERTLRGAGLLR